MNRQELIDQIAKRTDLPKASADKMLTALMDTVTDALAAGDNVALVGFGTFDVTAAPARTGRNPKTGEAMEIVAANRPKFRPGLKLKKAVNPAAAA